MVERYHDPFAIANGNEFAKMSKTIAHYRQRCRAANPLGTDFCTHCGTRLMLVVEPKATRFETAESGVSTHEHLLERISATENRISRLTERLERSLDLVLRQAQNSYFDRSLVKALVDVLAEDGLVNKERLEQLWTERCQNEVNDQSEKAERSGSSRPRTQAAKKRTTKRSRH